MTSQLPVGTVLARGYEEKRIETLVGYDKDGMQVWRPTTWLERHPTVAKLLRLISFS